MRAFPHIFLLLLLISSRLHADVVDLAAFRDECRKIQPGNTLTESAQFTFPRFLTVFDWLSQADQHLIPANSPVSAADPLPQSAASDADPVRVSELNGSEALNQTWLLAIPRSAYTSAMLNPVFQTADKDVSFGLQHPGFRSPLRQIYLDRCRLAVRQSLEKSQTGSAASDASAAPCLRVAGLLDGLVSAMRQSQSGPHLLPFTDPAFAQDCQGLAMPDLSAASQPFPLLSIKLPGKPFRPLVTLQSQWQRFQAVLLSLQHLTQTRLLEHQSGFPGSIVQTTQANRTLLPAFFLGVVVCAMVARQFRRTAH